MSPERCVTYVSSRTEPMAGGRLVQVGPSVKHREVSYLLEYRKGSVPAAKLEVLLNWFRDQAAMADGTLLTGRS